MFADILALLLGVTGPGHGAALPAQPAMAHFAAPESRTVVTRYDCADGKRSFSIRYTRHIFSEFGAAVRRGRAVSRNARLIATAALRRLDSFETIVPECSPTGDVLIVLGRVGTQRVALFLRWSGSDIVASEPQPVV